MCTPPLQLVQNGPAGNLPIQPLDPTPPQINNSPTFTDLAESLLDDLDIVGDGYEDLVAAATTELAAIDTTAAAMDETLDEILAILAIDPGTPPLDNDFDVFASDGDGINSLVDNASSISLPALGTIPLVTPGGQGVITYGGSPSTGGTPNAGDPAYTLHFQLPYVVGTIASIGGFSMAGPNPPFTGDVSMDQEAGADGRQYYFALIGINPAAAGSFTGTLTYTVVGILGGIEVPRTYNVPVQMVVNG